MRSSSNWTEILVLVVKEAPFTGKEPARLYPLRSSGGEYVNTSLAADSKKGDKWKKTPMPEIHGGSGANRLPLSHSSQSMILAPSSSSNAPQLVPGQYRTLEREMELKAISLNIRREFFVYLQRMRDLVSESIVSPAMKQTQLLTLATVSVRTSGLQCTCCSFSPPRHSSS